MPRRYIVTDENRTALAASDLIQCKGASNKIVAVIRWWWRPYDNTLPTAQTFATRCRRLPATVTDGTGGATVTPRALDPGDTAATFTARAGDTAKTTTSGTAVVVDESGAHIYNGYEQQPEKPVILGPSDAFVFELLNSALQGTCKINIG